MTERQLERKCCRLAEAQGWLALKMTSPNRVGVPDRVFIGPDSKILWVELKAQGGYLSGPQERCIATFHDLGHTVFVVYTVEQFEALLQVAK